MKVHVWIILLFFSSIAYAEEDIRWKDADEKMQEQQYEEAAKYLDKFSADDYMVAPAIIGTMGNCYAQMGQLDKAAATLLKAADKANSTTLSPIYLLQAGQILQKQGKNAEAVEAYKQIKTKYANSFQAMDIDKYIDRASIK